MDGLGKGVVVCDEHAVAALDHGLEVVGHMVGGLQLLVEHSVVRLSQGKGVAGKPAGAPPPIHCSRDASTMQSDPCRVPVECLCGDERGNSKM